MNVSFPRLCPLGDAALTITFGDAIDRATHARVLAFATAVRGLHLVHVDEVVPAYAAVTVFYNPLFQTYADLAKRLLEIAQPIALADAPEPPRGKLWEVPVRYDGPDLAEVARRRELDVAEVVRRHTAPEYTVFMLGFAPGFAYLGPLDPALVLPRRELPRRAVKPGSVAIAGAQTAIYPLATPGGWHLLGHTDLKPFDASRDPATLFAPGDRVKFVGFG